MKPKKARTLFYALIGAGLVLMIMALLVGSMAVSITCAALGIALAAAAYIAAHKYWRCKSCGKPLGIHGSLTMQQCPFCKENIE